MNQPMASRRAARPGGSRAPLLALLSVALLGATACRRSPARESAAFASAWSQATRTVEPLVVGSEAAGAALLDSVHRTARPAAVTPPPEGEARLPALPGGAAEAQGGGGSPPPLPATLPPDEMARVIRSGMSGLKQCYRQAEASASDGGGKAIVRFRILPTGSVEGVAVEAPAFEASRLPGCVSVQVRGWRFPPFQGEPVSVTYPFVFVGSFGN